MVTWATLSELRKKKTKQGFARQYSTRCYFEAVDAVLCIEEKGLERGTSHVVVIENTYVLLEITVGIGGGNRRERGTPGGPRGVLTHRGI